MFQLTGKKDYSRITVFSVSGRGFPCKNDLKNLDLSCKTDLDLLKMFWNRKTYFIAELYKTGFTNLFRVS